MSAPAFTAQELEFIYYVFEDLRSDAETFIDNNPNSLERNNALDDIKLCNSIMRKIKSLLNENGIDVHR